MMLMMHINVYKFKVHLQCHEGSNMQCPEFMLKQLESLQKCANLLIRVRDVVNMSELHVKQEHEVCADQNTLSDYEKRVSVVFDAVRGGMRTGTIKIVPLSMVKDPLVGTQKFTFYRRQKEYTVNVTTLTNFMYITRMC